MLDTTRRRILLLLLVSAVLISGVAGYQLQHDSVEAVTYSGPITITKGGTYSGNWQSNNTNPAVTIATTEPVVIENSNVRGYGHLISITAVADVTVRNSYGEGLWTTTAGTNFGRFIWSYGGVKNLTVEHNETVRAAAVKVVNARPKSLKIRYNKARNIYGDDSNCCGGGYMQFVQFGNVVGNGIEVAWNEVVNEAGKSRTEDIINLFDSGGASSADRLWIHDNFIWGSYGIPAATAGALGRRHHHGRRGRHQQRQVRHGREQPGGRHDQLRHLDRLRHRPGRAQQPGHRLRQDSRRHVDRRPERRSQPGSSLGVGPRVLPRLRPEHHVGQHGRLADLAGRNDWWTPAIYNSSSANYAGGGNSFTGNTSFKAGQTVTYADEQAEYTSWLTKSAGQNIGRAASGGPSTTAAPDHHQGPDHHHHPGPDDHDHPGPHPDHDRPDHADDTVGRRQPAIGSHGRSTYSVSLSKLAPTSAENGLGPYERDLSNGDNESSDGQSAPAERNVVQSRPRRERDVTSHLRPRRAVPPVHLGDRHRRRDRHRRLRHLRGVDRRSAGRTRAA